MGAPSALVAAKVVRADNRASLLGDEGAIVGAHPVGECVGAGHVPRKSIGLPVAQTRFKKPPNGVCILGNDGPNTHL